MLHHNNHAITFANVNTMFGKKYLMKKLLKIALRKCGFELRKLNQISIPLSRLENFFALWKRIGTKPSHIIDVGANHGNWTRSALKYFPESSFLLVEPQERLNCFLEDLTSNRKIRILNVGISDAEGTLKLALPTRDDSASFRPDAIENNPNVEVRVTTLDSLVKDSCPLPQICKIDAEGFDLKALKGAVSLLGVTEVFLVETAVCASGLENTMDRVISFMSEHNYRVFDITDLNQSLRDSALWLAEVVFVKNDSSIWRELTSYE
jgi:FkbM family methyltransferase